LTLCIEIPEKRVIGFQGHTFMVKRSVHRVMISAMGE
jgi:hypothetical protein